MDTELRQLAYISQASFEPSDTELLEILSVSRVCNERDQITGFLMYHDLNFFQVVEGPPEKIESLFMRLHRDVRHHHIIKILDRETRARMFTSWSMAFKSLSQREISELPVYSRYLKHYLSGDDQPVPGLIESEGSSEVAEMILFLKNKFVA